MTSIKQGFTIPEREITMRFVPSPGPGGQNTNKVSTAVQLRFDVRNSPSLPEEVKERLPLIAGRRLTSKGVLIIKAHRHRTRERNRRDALDRLAALIAKAACRRRTRKPTRPKFSSVQDRLESKKRRGMIKKLRSSGAAFTD